MGKTYTKPPHGRQVASLRIMYPVRAVTDIDDLDPRRARFDAGPHTLVEYWADGWVQVPPFGEVVEGDAEEIAHALWNAKPVDEDAEADLDYCLGELEALRRAAFRDPKGTADFLDSL